MSQPVAVQTLVRRTHEDRVLAALRAHGPLSRSELSEAVSLSRATLHDIVGDLLRRGALTTVAPAGTSPRGRGRPATRLALDPSAGQALGVDFGHSRVCVAAANAAHEIVFSREVAYAPSTPWARRVEIALDLVDRTTAETGTTFGALQGVGVGLPGPVSSGVPDVGWQVREGLTLTAGGGARTTLVERTLADRFGTPVHVDNNTRMAALAEAIWGAGADHDGLLYARVSEGIGGGLVLQGRLLTGSSGLAGEVGHVTVAREGLECRCGKRGCLETLASVPAVVRAVAGLRPQVRSFDDVVALLDAGDAETLEVVSRAGTYVGRVLAAACTTADPAVVVVAGEITRAGDHVLRPLARAFRDEVLERHERRPDPRPTALGSDAGALGAIAAVFNRSPLLTGYPLLAGGTTS